jgi:Tfp pilus assembly protein PilN
MTTLTTARVSEFPRVNLLPPEIAEAARLKRHQGVLGLLVLGALVLAGLLFFWANSQVSSAQDELTTAQAEGAQLNTKVASFAEVPEVLAELDAAEASLVQAMTPEVRWSFYLNNLSLTIPNSVRLTSFTAVNQAAADQLTGVAIAPTTPLGDPTMGSIQYTGMAKDYDAVAAWLQSVGQQEGNAEPSLSAATGREVKKDGEGLEYTGSTYLTLDAASMRYEQIIAAGE